MKGSSIAIGLVVFCFAMNPAAVNAHKSFYESAVDVAGHSSGAALIKINSVNPEYGSATDGPRTFVDFSVNSVLWGTVDNKLVLPEGSWHWLSERVVFTDVGGTPKPVEGESYLAIFSDDQWVGTPFTNSEEGLLRILQHEGENYLVSDLGECVVGTSAEDLVQLGPTVVEPVQYKGPIVGGTRYYWGIELNHDYQYQSEIDDEGYGTYFDEAYHDPSTPDFSECIDLDSLLQDIADELSNYSPASEFDPEPNFVGFAPPPVQVEEEGEVEGNVCYDSNQVPYCCF